MLRLMSAKRKPPETETALDHLDCADTELKFLGVGDDEGTLEGYASIFGEVDSGSDRVKRGAFAKSIKGRKASRIPMFFGHAHASVPIGVWTEITEDQKGLKVKGKLLLANSPEARQVRDVLMAKGEMGISIGYRTIGKAHITGDGKEHADWQPNSVRELRELDLREISLTAMPMLDSARVTGVKEEGGEGEPAERPNPAILALKSVAETLNIEIAMNRIAQALKT